MLHRAATHWAPWLALALVVRLAWLTDKSIWADEAARIAWAKGHDPMASSYFDLTPDQLTIRQPIGGFRGALRLTASHYPPGYALFYHPWMRLFGDSDFTLRLLAVLFGVGAVGVLWAVARLLFSPEVAAWAAAFAALSPFQVEYSQEIGQYAPGLFFEAASLLFVCRYALKQRWLDGVLWAAAVVLSIECHTYSGTLGLAEAAALGVVFAQRLLRPAPGAARPAWGRTLWALIWPGALMVLGVVPNLKDLMRGGVGEAANVGLDFSLGTILRAFELGLPTWWLGEAMELVVAPHPALAVAAAVAVFSAALFGGLRKAALERSFVLTLLVAPLLALAGAFLAQRNGQILWARYFVLLAVFFPVLTAAWVESLPRVARLVVAAAVVAGFGLGLRTYFHEPIKRPWREIAGLIERGATPDEAVVAFVPNMVEEMGWYLHRPLKLYGLNDLGHLGRDLETAAGGRPGVWSITAWGGGSPAVPWIRAHLACRYKKVEDFSYFRATLAHFTEPTGASTCAPAAAFELEGGECIIPAGASSFEVKGTVERQPADGAPIAVVLEREPPAPTMIERDAGIFRANVPMPRLKPGTWVDLEARRGDSPLSITTCLVRVPPAADSTVPRQAEGYFSLPAEGQSFAAGEPLRFAGWAFSTGGLDHLELSVDDAVVAKRFAVGEDRMDVVAAYPRTPQRVAQFSGFDVRALPEWKPGPHVVALYGVDLDGTRWLVGSKMNVTVRP